MKELVITLLNIIHVQDCYLVHLQGGLLDNRLDREARGAVLDEPVGGQEVCGVLGPML
jgi:hypothetical protein